MVFSVSLNWFPVCLRHHPRGELRSPQFCSKSSEIGDAHYRTGLYSAAQISRYMRALMLDNLGHDCVRSARTRGMTEQVVVLIHVLRNSLIPVVTVIALRACPPFCRCHHHQSRCSR